MNIKILGLASLVGLTAILGACAPTTTDTEPTVDEKTEEVEKSVEATDIEQGIRAIVAHHDALRFYYKKEAKD